MSTETPAITDDLDSFSAEFFGQSQPKEDVPVEEVKEEADDNAQNTEDTHVEESTDELDDIEDNDEPEPVKEEKPRRNKYQERINELVAKSHEAERNAAALQAKLDEVLTKLAPKQEPQIQAPVKVSVGPTPADTNEDGSEKYPLGEFDPEFIKDLTKHQFDQLIAERERVETENQQRAEAEKAQAELRVSWEGKLTPAQERYPDFAEKSQNLINSLGDLDPAYSQYLADTIMSLDHGPDVLYYLASNPTEAARIVRSGAQKALVAFGSIEARFSTAEDNKTARPVVSKAPQPPMQLNKGSAPAMIEVPDDTDDLDAFANKFFKAKKKA